MKAITLEQRQAFREFDEQEAALELRLKMLRERRREYINTNELNKVVSRDR